MIIDNELLNRLVREGEGITVLSTSPKLPDIVNEDSKLLQASDRLPLLDALRAVLACARRADGASAHPDDEVVHSVDKASLQGLIQSIVRVERAQGDLLDDTPFRKKVDAELDVVSKSYKVAERLAALVEEKLRLPMEQFIAVLKESPNREITENFLADSGPKEPGFMGPKGPLPALKIEMPPTLPTRKPIDLLVRVWSVREREGYARVEIKEFLDERAEKVLPHYASEVALSFDAESVQRDDLMAAQYLRREIRIRAAAECAIHERHARKTKLSLVRLLDGRSALDRLHGLASQIELQFDEHAGGVDGIRVQTPVEAIEE